MKWLIVGIATLVGIVVVAGYVMITSSSAESGQVAEIQGQGGKGEPLATGGAQLDRSVDGLRLEILVPTPIPGSYEYPTGDMVVEGAPSHPDVDPGGDDSPEVFTMWAFVFNYPDLCTDETCDFDDIDTDAPAKGGIFQTDGRIAAGNELNLAGSVRPGSDSIDRFISGEPDGR